jgi:hypothetical protein
MFRVGRYSELPSVVTAITRPYCNYGNCDTVLVLHAVSANINVIMVITSPNCNYDTYEFPDSDHVFFSLHDLKTWWVLVAHGPTFWHLDARVSYPKSTFSGRGS